MVGLMQWFLSNQDESKGGVEVLFMRREAATWKRVLETAGWGSLTDVVDAVLEGLDKHCVLSWDTLLEKLEHQQAPQAPTPRSSHKEGEPQFPPPKPSGSSATSRVPRRPESMRDVCLGGGQRAQTARAESMQEIEFSKPPAVRPKVERRSSSFRRPSRPEVLTGITTNIREITPVRSKADGSGDKPQSGRSASSHGIQPGPGASIPECSAAEPGDAKVCDHPGSSGRGSDVGCSAVSQRTGPVAGFPSMPDVARGPGMSGPRPPAGRGPAPAPKPRAAGKARTKAPQDYPGGTFMDEMDAPGPGPGAQHPPSKAPASKRSSSILGGAKQEGNQTPRNPGLAGPGTCTPKAASKKAGKRCQEAPGNTFVTDDNGADLAKASPTGIGRKTPRNTAKRSASAAAGGTFEEPVGEGGKAPRKGGGTPRGSKKANSAVGSKLGNRPGSMSNLGEKAETPRCASRDRGQEHGAAKHPKSKPRPPEKGRAPSQTTCKGGGMPPARPPSCGPAAASPGGRKRAGSFRPGSMSQVQSSFVENLAPVLSKNRPQSLANACVGLSNSGACADPRPGSDESGSEDSESEDSDLGVDDLPPGFESVSQEGGADNEAPPRGTLPPLSTPRQPRFVRREFSPEPEAKFRPTVAGRRKPRGESPAVRESDAAVSRQEAASSSAAHPSAVPQGVDTWDVPAGGTGGAAQGSPSWVRSPQGPSLSLGRTMPDDMPRHDGSLRMGGDADATPVTRVAKERSPTKQSRLSERAPKPLPKGSFVLVQEQPDAEPVVALIPAPKEASEARTAPVKALMAARSGRK